MNDKKILSTENKLAKRESSYQECLDRIQQLSESLESLGEAKRDLEV